MFRTKYDKRLKFSDAKFRWDAMLKLEANPILGQKLFPRKKGVYQKADTMGSNQPSIFRLEPSKRVVKCASELR